MEVLDHPTYEVEPNLQEILRFCSFGLNLEYFFGYL